MGHWEVKAKELGDRFSPSLLQSQRDGLSRSSDSTSADNSIDTPAVYSAEYWQDKWSSLAPVVKVRSNSSGRLRARWFE